MVVPRSTAPQQRVTAALIMSSPTRTQFQAVTSPSEPTEKPMAMTEPPGPTIASTARGIPGTIAATPPTEAATARILRGTVRAAVPIAATSANITSGTSRNGTAALRDTKPQLTTISAGQI